MGVNAPTVNRVDPYILLVDIESLRAIETCPLTCTVSENIPLIVIPCPGLLLRKASYKVESTKCSGNASLYFIDQSVSSIKRFASPKFRDKLSAKILTSKFCKNDCANIKFLNPVIRRVKPSTNTLTA